LPARLLVDLERRGFEAFFWERPNAASGPLS
jgi:hypothetical protein